MPASRTKKRALARKVSTHAPDNAGMANAVSEMTGSKLPKGEDLLGSEELRKALAAAKKR